MGAHRYQVVNGVEQVLYGSMPPGPAKALTVGMRLGNNLLGSVREPHGPGATIKITSRLFYSPPSTVLRKLE